MSQRAPRFQEARTLSVNTESAEYRPVRRPRPSVPRARTAIPDPTVKITELTDAKVAA